MITAVIISSTDDRSNIIAVVPFNEQASAERAIAHWRGLDTGALFAFTAKVCDVDADIAAIIVSDNVQRADDLAADDAVAKRQVAIVHARDDGRGHLYVKDTRPLWVIEHGYEFAVPNVVTLSLHDMSWHNDVSPSFCHADDCMKQDEEIVRLWVGHPDPDQRELEGPRYHVNGGQADEYVEHYAGDDVAAALDAFHAARTLPRKRTCATCGAAFPLAQHVQTLAGCIDDCPGCGDEDRDLCDECRDTDDAVQGQPDPDPDCPECQRSFGPHYRGPCTH